MDSIESRVYSDESPGRYSEECLVGYSYESTVDSMEYRVDTIESPPTSHIKTVSLI